jgi:heme A synthase
VKIFTPKLIILIVLASYLVSQNVYNYVTRPPLPEAPKVEVDKEKEFWEMFHRFKNYLIVAIVGFIVFYFLRKANDEHEEEMYQKTKQRDEEI